MLKKINVDIKTAMREKETHRRDILRLVLGKAKSLGKNDQKRKGEKEEVTSQDLLSAIQKQIKQNKDTIEICKENGRDYAKEQFEIELLTEYLPKQKTEQEMQDIVTSIVNDLPEDKRNNKGRGLVMGKLSQYKDVIDMGKASAFAGTLLNK